MNDLADYSQTSIHAMLHPRSIALIGATPRMHYGGKFLKRLLAYRDRVEVYPINPKYNEIMDQPCQPSITSLAQAPDLAVIIVPWHAVLQTMQECSEKGVKAGIVISAGFSERGTDERRGLQKEIGRFARASGFRITGPNCLGLANIHDDLWLTSSSRVLTGSAGPIGLICQSGATLFGPLLARAADNGIGLSYAISTGNEADLEFADFARYLLDDPGTKVIAGFIEGFKDANKFVQVAKLAAERGKPLVIIKIGRSEQGARAAGSHTAALTGSDALYDAVCKQYGVIRVTNYDELLDISQVLAHFKLQRRDGVAVVSHSGGVSSLTADMLGNDGITLPALSPNAESTINAILNGFGAASNPADITGKANSEEFPAIIGALADEEEIGTLVVASAGGDRHAEQLIALRDTTDKNVAYLWTGSRAQETGLPKLKAAGIPIMSNPDGLAKALRAAFDYHAWREQRVASQAASKSSASECLDPFVRQGRTTLTESEGKQLLREWGIASPRERLVSSASEAAAAAQEIGFPVVMKIDSPDIQHKTEAGGVKLDVRDAQSSQSAFDEITSSAMRYAPDARINGVVVQEMVSGGVEMIVGITYDAQLGATLLVGSGGVMVEVFKDVALRQCPVSRHEAMRMIDDLKGSVLLRGFRGSPPADTDALADALVEISQVAMQCNGKLAEMDINPLLVLPAGEGVRALDALITLCSAGNLI
ncbi:hypothetical protein EOS_05680 [Caballeronia mineralivorans PML1(12)]|uniref:ATP-grasp domain-containing protein n=1 Tax=Caballeronia mineralivorans PML1(12) TaxID=908627 RepID=A0A0J1D389_9BURK|nr:acetate--CoA ligase family protein [Caballeronia mineralivorans]KLU27180.1 hypothetical protein EOS_05680 [Caballeronia mineralivorans PML1(12)]